MKLKKLFLLNLLIFSCSTQPFFGKFLQKTAKVRYKFSRAATIGYCISLAHQSKLNSDCYFNDIDDTIKPQELPALYHIIKNEQKRYGFDGNIEVMRDIQAFQAKSTRLQPYLLSVTNEFYEDFLSKAPKLVGEKYRGVLQHEFGHMKENILTKPYFRDLFIAGIIITRSLLATRTPIKTAILTTLATKALGIIFQKHKEQRADDRIENNIKTLEGVKKFLEKQLTEFPEMVKDINSDLAQKFCIFLIKTLDGHPTPEARISKLEQRIAILKDPQGYQRLLEQEQQNSIKNIGYLG